MRTVKYALWGLLGLCLIIIGFANRNVVTITLLPEELQAYVNFNWSISLPLYAVVFGGIGVGLLIGFFLEWIREHRHRAQAATDRRDKENLEAEVRRMNKGRKGPQDEVLAILDEGATAR